MNDYVEEYINIRMRLCSHIHEMAEVYLTGCWDPMMIHIIIKELKQIIVKELSHEYPDFPIEYLPKVKIKVDTDSQFIEIGVQEYFNETPDLIFLGNIEHDYVIYDLYCRDSWDPYFSHVFYARNGHEENAYEKGSKEPAAEYMMGIMTPLSIAYSFAIDEGFIQ